MSFKKFGWGGEFDSVDSKVAAERRGMDQIAASGVNRLRRRQAKQVVDPHLLGLVKTIQEKNGIEGGFDYSYLYQALFGERPVWVAQQIGSCVASGSMRTIAYRSMAECFLLGSDEELLGTEGAGRNCYAPFAPYHYRAGRHFAGINGYQDGSLCLPQVQGLMEFGMLRCDTEGLQSNKFPEPDDDQLYKRWGASDELLDQFKHEGQRHLLLESEPVNDADSAEVLLTEHFKPLNMCSSWAFKADRKHPTWKDDRGVPVMIYTRDRGDTWHHNVSIVGCVMVNGRIFFTVLNQWGYAHHQREWFVVTGEEMQDWLNDSGTVCQSVGDIGLNSHGNDIFGEG